MSRFGGSVRAWSHRWLLIVGMAFVAVLAAATPAQADRVINGTFRYLTLSGGGDAFYNYDFNSQSISSTNVDWAVNLVFVGNATVPKVKAVVSSIMPYAGSIKYAFVAGGWDQDRGLKQTQGGSCPGGTSYHFRVYAPSSTDRMYNVNYGYFVVGTAHNDYKEGCSGSYAGDNEQAEAYVRGGFDARGYLVVANAFWLNNVETTYDGGHHWNNNGYATRIWI